MLVSASIMNINILELKEKLNELIEGGITMFHLDIMDGNYVPNLSYSVKTIAEIKEVYPQIVFDVHLMVNNPLEYIEPLSEANVEYFSFHSDSTRFVRRTIDKARSRGLKPGIVINPSQQIDSVESYANYVDMVTVMTVEPGFAGQSFLEGGIERLRELTTIRKRLGCNFVINVDGGADYAICDKCYHMGIDIVVGTIHNIFKQPEGLKNACIKFNNIYNK
ncbi:MAG TPA: ribulose-phosphate 3-epimerase [Christensenellaceae bacterium]|nr:ribulose-phosphate 3-epimerase [Christensenellaceae bacterium]